MPTSRSVTTLYEVDGHEFVDVDDFLACYPKANERAKAQIKQLLETFDGDVEKRIEDPLFDRLISTCWKADTSGVLYSPIVLRDGWVIWVNWGHSSLIDSLGRLFEQGDGPMTSIDLLTGGHGWYISTIKPKIIWTGKAYRPTRADEDIFSAFQVRHID